MIGPHGRARRAARVAGLWLTATGLALALVSTSGGRWLTDAVADPNPNVTICHATSSATNPYTNPTVDASSILPPAGHGDHVGDPTGPYDPGADYSGKKSWGDVIPPFDYEVDGNPTQYPGLNWTPAGQAIWEAGCIVEGTITVVKDLVPPSDPGIFDLQIDGSTEATGGDGTTASATVAYGTHTVGELGGSGTELADYLTQIVCQNAGDVELPPVDDTVSEVTVQPGDDWTCTITNGRNLTALRIDKSPSDQAIADGGSVSWTITVTNTGDVPALEVVVTDQVNPDIDVSGAVYENGALVDEACASGGSNQVSCEVGDIPSGGSATVTITATEVGDGCSYANIASASADNAPQVGSDEATVTVTDCLVPQDTTLAVEKTGTEDVADGGTVSFTITVTNTGDSPATNVVVTDSVPVGLTVSEVTFVNGANDGSCTAQQEVSCNVGTLPAGESATVTITATESGSGCRYTNVAAAAADNTSPVESEPHPVHVVCVTLSKSGPAEVDAGGTVSYTVTVNNSGPSEVSVEIVDDPDDDLSDIQASSSDLSCTVDSGTQVVTCTGTVAADASGAISISGTAPSRGCPEITNQATGSVTEPAEARLESGIITTTLTGCEPEPLLALTKTSDPTSAPAGAQIGFTVTVTNTGQEPARGVEISDALPGGLNWSADPGPPTCLIQGGTLSCDVGTLDPGASFSVRVTATSRTDFCGTLFNTAVVTANNAPGRSAGASVILTCQPGVAGLVVTKQADAELVHVGDTITYTFTVTLAPGSDAVDDVVVIDPVCDQTPSGPTGDDGDGVLEPGETWGYTCTHVVTQADPDPLPNMVTICATGPLGQVCGNDEDEVDIANPAIRIVKSADPTTGTIGTKVTYTYVVTNTGDVQLSNVSVDDDKLGHICAIPLLQPGESRTCTATFTIPSGSSTEIRNVVVAIGTDPIDEEVRDQDDFTIRVTIVAGTTVTPPGGVAFTGPGSAVVPVAGLALLMLTTGSGLLWLGRRRPEPGAGGTWG